MKIINQVLKNVANIMQDGEPMYLPNIDDHIIPGNSKCNDIEENNELGLLTIKREYGIDKNNNVYNISTIPAILIGKKIGKK